MRVVVLAALLALSACALPPAPQQDLVPQSLVQDVPAVVRKPDPPVVDEDGIIVEDVVNVHKRAVVLVMSTATTDGANQRKLIRDTWMQPLNRSSTYALPSEDRRSFAVWFVIARDLHNPAFMVPIEHEGKLNGDILVVNPADGYSSIDNLDSVGALLRWLRVAYFERYDFAVFTDDHSFVSLYNLRAYCDSHLDSKKFVGGFVNRFELAPAEYTSKYFAPFVQHGTLVVSYAVAEIIARELPYMKHVGRWDASIAHFLLPYEGCQPHHSSQFVDDLSHVYSALADPVIINNVPLEMMEMLSKPVLVNGKWVTPTLPAQVEEMRSTHVYIDPHYKDEQPECNALAANSKCNMAALRALEGDHMMNAH